MERADLSQSEYSGTDSRLLIRWTTDTAGFWTDGCICTSAETKIFRNAQRPKKLIDKLDRDRVVSKAERDEITNKLILYAEHTWEHFSSSSDSYKLLYL